MFWFIVGLFLAYLAYQVIFKLVLPIYRTTKQVKRTFRDMQERMHTQGGQSAYPQQPEQRTQPQAKSGDYIEFEEVK